MEGKNIMELEFLKHVTHNWGSIQIVRHTKNKKMWLFIKTTNRGQLGVTQMLDSVDKDFYGVYFIRLKDIKEIVFCNKWKDKNLKRRTETSKKRKQMEVLELKIQCEIKISLDGLYSRMHMTGKISMNLNTDQWKLSNLKAKRQKLNITETQGPSE